MSLSRDYRVVLCCMLAVGVFSHYNHHMYDHMYIGLLSCFIYITYRSSLYII